MGSICYYSTIDPGVLSGDANEYVTLAATLPQLPADSRSSLGQGQQAPPKSAPPYTQHDLEILGNSSMTPPPPYTKPKPETIIGEPKSASHTYGPSPPLRRGFDLNDDGSSVFAGAREEPSVQQLCDLHGDQDFAAHDIVSLAMEPIPTYCATICTSTSGDLNYHVNPDDKKIHRWRTTDGSIPVSINLKSFESVTQSLKVQECLEAVLRNLNDKNLGPKFHFVKEPSESAFFITHGIGRARCYASAFFPGSDPKDWYIYIYKLGLELDKDCLINILTHEMLHVVGVRHCYVDPKREYEPFLRYPLKLSDTDNWDGLMQSHLDLNDLSKHKLEPRTVKHVREIYDMPVGEKIDGHEIQDVSWKLGAEEKRAIAKHNAC